MAKKKDENENQKPPETSELKQATTPAAEESPASPELSPFDKLVRQKLAAGLPKADAEAVAKAQLEHDAALAASAKK